MVSVGINTFIELWKEILLNGILNFIAKAFGWTFDSPPQLWRSVSPPLASATCPV